MTTEPLRVPGRSDTAAIIQLSALTKNSGPLTAVAGIDLSIHRGEVLGGELSTVRNSGRTRSSHVGSARARAAEASETRSA